MKLLLDEQISGKVAARLQRQGHDTIAATTDASLRGLSDPDLFEVAQEQGRAIVTYNRVDFEAIIREYAGAGKVHHGLVIVHPTRFPSRELTRLAKALAALADTFPASNSFTIWLQESGASER